MLQVEASNSGPAAFLSAKNVNRMDNIPSVTSVIVRKINNREFDAYLTSISEVIDKFQLHKALGPSAFEGIPVLDADEEEAEKDIEELYRLCPLKVAPSMDRINRTRMLSSSPKTWLPVPEVFKRDDFDLKLGDVYNAVYENKDLSGLNAAEEGATYRKIQDKLTNHRDTIEVQLLQEISRRSSSFFGALENLQQLEVETVDCVKKIESLRQSLASIRKANVERGLRVIRIKEKRSNLTTLYGAVKLVGQAKQSQPVIKVLLAQGDYIGALDFLEEASTLINGQTIIPDVMVGKIEQLTEGLSIIRMQPIIPHKLDLTGVPSVSHLSVQLNDISFNISNVMEEEFSKLLKKDLLHHLDLIATTPYSQKNGPSAAFNGVAATSIRNILSETYAFPSTPATTVAEFKFDMPSLSPQDEGLKASLIPLVYGLLRMDRLDVAMGQYRDMLYKQLKLASMQSYPKTSQPLTPLSKAAKKAYEQEEQGKQLKQMTFDDFYATLITIFIFFLRGLQRAAIVNEILIGIIKDAEDSNVKIGTFKRTVHEDLSIKTEDDDDFNESCLDLLQGENDPFNRKSTSKKIEEEVIESSFAQTIANSRAILFSATELTHTRCAKLLIVRQEQNSQLNPKDFYRLFNATWEFLLAGEQLCGKMCFGLKGSILAQAKSYINYFHEEKSKQIALLLDNEQWVQADIPIDFQHMTEQLQSNEAFSTPPVSKRSSRTNQNIDLDSDDELDMSNRAKQIRASVESMSHEQDVSSKFLLIDGTKYYAVVSVLLFLKMLTDYVQCAKNVPSLTSEILNRIYEFLKFFNSRTCQLVLGSGAMRSAGLENITAKHIGLVMAVIPYIRTGISTLLNSRQKGLLTDFDRIVGDYRDHQNELYMHLVGIMNDRLHTHSEHLVAINWDSPDQRVIGSDGVSVTMSTLVKETSTLHKVISKYLPKESVKSIMNEVFRTSNRKLEEEVKKIDLFTAAGKNRLLVDAHYFTETLAQLDSCDGPGSHLEVVVNNIKIKDKRVVVPPKAPIMPPKAPIPPSKFALSFGKILRQQNDGE